MEIGSIFEIDPNCIENAKKNLGTTLCLDEVEKYGKKYTSYTSSGRQAIAAALKFIEKKTPDISKKCLLPTYMCDTVFFPFEQNGWEIYFYHIGINLRADKEELCRKIEEVSPDLLFVHAYYGVDTWKELRPVLHEYQSNGLILMEDVTQAYYMQEADARADYIVGSLRKWYSVPDGGFVTTDEVLETTGLKEDSFFTGQRINMLTSKWDYLSNLGKEPEVVAELQSRKAEFLALNRKMEEYLDENENVMSISDVSASLLSDVDEKKYFITRNVNYKILYKGFQDRKSVRIVPDMYVKNAAPLYFPIYAENRDELQKFFCENDIYAPVLWPIGKGNEGALEEGEKYIFSHLLAIPMDHRYGKAEMLRIIEVLDKYENEYR